jgi:hypothetical protein
MPIPALSGCPASHRRKAGWWPICRDRGGGLAVWRHSVIRFLLQRSRIFPGRAPQFLNDASARFLLRRVGGGYSFVHRLLLDHLASRETAATAVLATRAHRSEDIHPE